MAALSDNLKNKIKGLALKVVNFIIKILQQKAVVSRVKTQLKLRYLSKTLKQQNLILKNEIAEKQKVEKALLKLNNDLIMVNAHLKMEIAKRRRTSLELQKEILEREQTEIKLQKSLEQKELLLQEIHHRVKNNLFVASSLVGLQTNYIDNPEIIKVLEHTQERIKTMALIHEHLYSSTDLEKIDFYKYVQNLTRQILYSYNCHSQNINLVINVLPISLNIETANPCGLIINELVSNSLEHGFKNSSQGSIYLTFKKNNSGQFILIVKDDGVGFPANKNLHNSESLGLQLVYTLVEQLEGEIELNSNNGTEITITFSELHYKKRI